MAAGLLAAVLTLASCSAGSSGLGGPPSQVRGAAVTYVSIDEGLSIQDGTGPEFRLKWQQLFLRSALPLWAVEYEINEDDFIDSRGAEWQDAETQLIAQVASLRPTVVTVVLGEVEARTGISTATFAGALNRLLAALHGDEIPTVLVANVVPMAPSASQPFVTSYNAAIAAATKAHGDVLVDVHGALVRAGDAANAGVLTSQGVIPREVELVAQTFEAAMRNRPDSRH
jgi:hypothetical protein